MSSSLMWYLKLQRENQNRKQSVDRVSNFLDMLTLKGWLETPDKQLEMKD